MTEQTTIDFAKVTKRAKSMSDAELALGIGDAGAAVKAYPEGDNAVYYTDKIYIYATELRCRAGTPPSAIEQREAAAVSGLQAIAGMKLDGDTNLAQLVALMVATATATLETVAKIEG